MNYMFKQGSNKPIVPEDDLSDIEEGKPKVPEPESESERMLRNFVKTADVSAIDLTSKEANVRDNSKQALMSYVENLIEESGRNGKTADETMESLRNNLSSSGENGFSASTIQNFIDSKRKELEMMEHTEHVKKLQQKQKDEEAHLLDSLKKRADSTSLDDRYVPVNRSEDRRDYSSPEFTTLQYVPVCCDSPATFASDGYQLRCLRETKRTPRLMVVITMYNEPPDQLRATLRSVGNNIKELQSRQQRFKGWGEDVWKDVCVCIVSDGRTKVSPETLDWLESHGMYNEDLMQYRVESQNEAGEAVYKSTTMHLFERSVLLDKQVKKNRLKKAAGKGAPDEVVELPPMQLVFALKEANAQKLNSHYWFFKAFCEDISPDFCIMVDVGTMPTHNAFTLLLTEMATNKQIGGTCGEIVVDQPYSSFFNWVKLAQHFEYKVSNFLDKAHESAFGYISVLPGAFSAYRFKAIQGTPMERYFAPLTNEVAALGPMKGNMYLAEDRILCIEILAKKDENWLMSYVKDARARTDVPDDLNSLILQRRRWINGSFFASMYALINYYRVFTESSHDSLRKFALFFLFIYQVVVFIGSWFQIALFILTIYFVLVDGVKQGNIIFVDGSLIPDEFFTIFITTYGCILFSQLVLALGNKLRYVKKWYSLLSLWYGLIMVVTLTFTFTIFFLVDPTERGGVFVVVAAALSLGIILVAALLHGELHHIVLTIVQYLILLPVLVNVLTMYSMSNLHDLSWGTKGLQEVELKNKELKIERMRGELGSKYQNLAPEDVEYLAREKRDREQEKLDDVRHKRFTTFRSYMLMFYLACQLAMIFTMINAVETNDYFQFFALFVGGINAFKMLGSTYFLAITKWRRMRVWFFVKFGWKFCLCFNSEEMHRHKDIVKQRNVANMKNNMHQIEHLFQGETGNNLLYVKEDQDDGIAVRESTVHDRSFYRANV